MDMNFSILIPLVSSISVFFLGIFVFAQNRRSLLNIIFLLFTLAIFIWLYSTSKLFASTTDAGAVFWDTAVYAAIVFVPALLFHLGVMFSEKHTPRRKMVITAGYVLALIFLALLLFTPYFFDGVNWFWWGAHLAANTAHHFFLVYFTTYIMGMLYVLHIEQKETKSEKKRSHMKLMFHAILILCTGALGFLPAYGFDVYPFAYISAVIFTFIVAYGILKYNFLTISTFSVQLFVFLMVAVAFFEIFVTDFAVSRALNVFSFVVITFFGFRIVANMKEEIARKEKLEKLSAELSQANEDLKKLDKAKSEFISIASHQLRTPLTAIKGYLSLIMEGTYGGVSSEVDGAVRKVYKANERIINLVEDLLNISRIESGRMQYKFESVDMSEILEDLRDIFVNRAKDQGLEFTIDLPNEPLTTNADKAKILEVVSNVIDNAIKYTEKGFVKVIAKREGAIIKIDVIDSGIGIPARVLPQLFEKFSRGKDPSRLHVDGTGLGLYVGKNIIEAHKGRITINSEGAGKGTTFGIEIPFREIVKKAS